jgi:hypothetical protein
MTKYIKILLVAALSVTIASPAPAQPLLPRSRQSPL